MNKEGLAHKIDKQLKEAFKHLDEVEKLKRKLAEEVEKTKLSLLHARDLVKKTV